MRLLLRGQKPEAMTQVSDGDSL